MAVAMTLGSCSRSPDSEQMTAPTASKDWSKDPRLVSLVTTCYEKGRFDQNTSEMLPVLIEKLQSSSLDVLRNVREELAMAGEPAVAELDRVVRRLYSDAHSAPIIINALGVIQLSEAGGGPTAEKLLRDCLGHPQETIRTATIRALTRHAKPSHFDDLLAVLAHAHGTTQGDVITAMVTADRRRLEEELASWLERDEMRGLQVHAARLVAQGADATTAELFEPLVEQVENPAIRAFLESLADDGEGYAGGGNPYLAAMLEDDDPRVRSQALTALEFTDSTDLIATVLTSDSAPGVRLMATGLLGHRTGEPLALAALQIGLNDADDKVREACLRFLLQVGDDRAMDTALEYLGGSQAEVGMATRAMARNWDSNPGLSDRAFRRLRTRWEEGGGRHLLQALAQVPGPQSTEWLLERVEELDGQPEKGAEQSWLILQASNSGSAGREVLRAAWRSEDDLERRFDLLWAASLEHDAETRAFLLEVLDAPRSEAHERLHVAERLAREGPASLVAPRIKRANLRMSDPVFRPAMECLLWRWYG